MRTLQQRREYYRNNQHLTQEEIMHNMPLDELKYNALRKKGRDAIKELERRESEKARHVTPQPEIDIGV